MMLFEETDTSDFIQILTKTLGISDDEVDDLIEKMDVDVLSDLIDACMKDDTNSIREIASTVQDKDESEDQEEPVTPEEPEIGDLLAPKDKLRARKKKENKKVLQRSEDDTELGEQEGPPVTFGHGDKVAVNGQEATVKIPSAAGDTVGVLINGELEMVDRKSVHPLKEGVLGMTKLPGLKPSGDLQRIRELAGLPAEDYNEPEPAIAPAPMAATAQPPMTPPTEEVPLDTMASAEHEEPAMDSGMPDDGMGDDMGGDLGAHEMDAPVAPMAAPMATPPMAGPMDGLGTGLEDAAALDQAISDIEGLIPNVKISEYKTLVARLEALVSMAKSAGKAALTEASNPALKAKVAAFAAGRKPKTEDKISPKSIDGPKPQPAPKAADMGLDIGNSGDPEKVEVEGARKTLMDYVKEAEAEGMAGHETIGQTRMDAIKALQSRMGPGVTPQDATTAFDTMMKDGGIQQKGSAFTMAPMDDNSLKTNLAAMPKPTQSATQSTTNTDDEDSSTSGTNTTNPGANVQGASNPSYQGG